MQRASRRGSNVTGVYYKLLKDGSATMRSKFQALRFVEGMQSIEPFKLMADLSDERKHGKQRISEALSYIGTVKDLEELFIPMLRCGINDATSKPLYREARNRFLREIYLVSMLMSFLDSTDTVERLSPDSATTLCLFLLVVAKAYRDARNSDKVESISRKLSDRGDVSDAKALGMVLLLDEKRQIEDSLARAGAANGEVTVNSEIALWITDSVPPGGRHDNDCANFRDIELVPTADELNCATPSYLPLSNGANLILTDPTQRLLDKQFRLLREDAVETMRSNIKDLIHVWENARIMGIDFRGRQTAFHIQLDVPNGVKIDFTRARVLQQGTVIALLDENDRLRRTAVIVVGRSDLRGEWLLHKDGPIIGIAITNESDFSDSIRELTSNRSLNTEYAAALSDGDARKAKRLRLSMQTYKLVEVSKSFFAYQPVLQALQAVDTLPFVDELCNERKPEDPSPEYLPDRLRLPPGRNFGCHSIDRRRPSVEDIVDASSLDRSQAQSILHAFASRVALIQGPPGTGKTFIGGVITQMILENTKAKILCMCYTNHALDQFLEHMLDAGLTSIVRLGGRTKSSRLAPYQLRDLVLSKTSKSVSISGIKQLDAQVHKCREEIEKAIQLLEKPVTWKEPNGGISACLQNDFPEIYRYVSLEVSDDGFEIVGPRGKRLDAQGLWKLWQQGRDFPPEYFPYKKTVDEDAFDTFWSMPLDERSVTVKEVYELVLDPFRSSVVSLVSELASLKRQREELAKGSELEILKQARLIGATTSGAAKYKELLGSVDADVVVVEEAGEVLEAHVVASLSQSTKHLILIGDHMQLRPKAETYRLTTTAKAGYDLDISLFERLALAQLPSVTLEMQHRMRPSISSLIRNQTYPALKDHKKVFEYPEVRGVCSSCDGLVFINHNNCEDGIDSVVSDTLRTNTSKSNEFEADMCVEIIRYLRYQGYHTDQLVVLTPYLGQLFKISRKMKEQLRDLEAYISDQDLEDFEDEAREVLQSNGQRNTVRVSSVDNYQGEESDIVVVSLVRGNKQGSIGFLKEPQRVNVLLSRAKHGMILIGNAETLVRDARGREVWEALLSMLEEKGQVHTGLPTFCRLHPQDGNATLRTPKDFRSIRPNGGCHRPCTDRLSCGHVCSQMCHPIDRNHEQAHRLCCEPCRRVPEECLRNHLCTKLCNEECGSCLVDVGPVDLPCGHAVSRISCHDSRSEKSIAELSYKCKTKLSFRFSPCGHTAETTCGNVQQDKPKCPCVCSVSMPCGHACILRCSDCSGKHDCKERCQRKLFCGHFCGRACHSGTCPPCTKACAVRCEHSNCPKVCHEVCPACLEDCEWTCEHAGACPLVCGAPCVRLPCNKRCSQKLKCGHRCPSICGEPCPPTAYCQECAGSDVLAEVVDMVMMSEYKKVNIDEDPIVVLPCSHFFTMSTLDGHVGLSSVYELNQNGNPVGTRPLRATGLSDESKFCITCRAAIHSVHRYGRIVNYTTLQSLERKHMQRFNSALANFASKPSVKPQQLVNLRKQIEKSPMRSVVDACGRENSDVGNSLKPPARPLLECLRMLAEAYRNQVQNESDTNWKKTVETYQEAIAVAVQERMFVREAELRLRSCEFLLPYCDEYKKHHSLFDETLDAVFALRAHLAGPHGQQILQNAQQLREDMSLEGRRRTFRQVVQAMGTSLGYGGAASDHWFQCPNGHPYFIGECGGAMQESTCPDCGALVGGSSHMLNPDNRSYNGPS